jgi:hypothetical protein
MSVRASSDVRLSLGILLGPVIALLNQEAIYSGTMWACGFQARGTLHVIPALCLLAVLFVAFDAFSMRRGATGSDGRVAARTRFLALLGVALSVFSAVVILIQWFGIFTFDACMRA